MSGGSGGSGGFSNVNKRKFVQSVSRKLMNRKTDTRSILTKAICGVVKRPIAVAHLERARELRGDIESRGWRGHVPCLYCGRPATEVDHYRSAVFEKRGRFIVETPVNRVPSCSGCHRAGKDRTEDIVAWHAKPLAECSPKHPRRVSEDWAAAHARVREWDAFHRGAITAYTFPDQALFQYIVETVLDRMYDDQRAEIERLLAAAVEFSGGF